MRPPWARIFPEFVQTPGCLRRAVGREGGREVPCPQGRAEKPVLDLQPDEGRIPQCRELSGGSLFKPGVGERRMGQSQHTGRVSHDLGSTPGKGGLLLSGEGCLGLPRFAGHCPDPLTRGSCLCRPGAPSCGPRSERPGLGTLGRAPVSHPTGLSLKPAVGCSSSLTSWIFRAI